MPYGRQLLGPQSIYPTSVLAAPPGLWKPGGITLDWSTVAAVATTDVTLADGSVIKIGQKYLRFGQILTQITTGGQYGPYDTAASDGRQLLARGKVYIVEKTVLQLNQLGFTTVNTDNFGVLEGGTLWKARILMTTGTHTLAAGPTVTEFEAVFPMVQYAQS